MLYYKIGTYLEIKEIYIDIHWYKYTNVLIIIEKNVKKHKDCFLLGLIVNYKQNEPVIKC